MPEANRAEWLKVAHMTLADLPADLLARGCAKARRTCQFPSQIVPCIVEETASAMRLRREQVQHEPRNAPRLPEPDYVDPAEVRRLIQSLGSGA